jgi:hypothetical protein
MRLSVHRRFDRVQPLRNWTNVGYCLHRGIIVALRLGPRVSLEHGTIGSKKPTCRLLIFPTQRFTSNRGNLATWNGPKRAE